mmetsp:Transcript_38699/g.90479  ORF Transcript_38699/g.90479 Transcript_38699/m.90479 type:complete len:126 (-) Transcript_38699:265-642(-)
MLGDHWASSPSSSGLSFDGALNHGGGFAADDHLPVGSRAGQRASAATPAEAASTLREEIYRGALASTSVYGLCAKANAKPVVDSVYNACVQDFAPFTASGQRSPFVGFPPMPPEVAAAAKAFPTP